MALNPFQKAVESLALSMGLKGSAQQAVYQTPQYANLVNQFFGAIPLPAGINESMVGSRTPFGVEYTDPEGYIHQLMRDVSGISPRLGEVRESSTNRPAVLPIEKTNPLIGQILGLGGTQSNQGALGEGQPFFGLPTTGVPAGSTTGQSPQQPTNLLQLLQQTLGTPTQLSTLDPRAMELLATMKAAEDQALQEQFQRQSGTAVAQLVGQGVGASSIAGDILGQLLQRQGLVQNQAQGQQAQRQLGLQQFLTGQQGQQNQNLQGFIEQLLGLGTNRDISGAQVGLGQQQLGTQNEQFFRQMQEQIRQFDEQMRFQERQSFLNNIFKGVAGGLGVVTGLPFGKIGSLFGGGGGAITGAGSQWPQN